ncbi:MAG: UDP-3-O-(3-hydroxymyristoyl)glucosamine N-acyltransferase [Rikenellaceae bacterium]|nr:UDP-3-O-(3-hydroxymyristoyl)glucosamine N-acyltransferase [Rikenellaceae bacterium]
MEFTAEIIAGFLGGEIIGDRNAKVWTVSKIEEGKSGSLAFLANPKYESFIYDTEASIVIVNSGFIPKQEIKTTLIKVDDAYAAFARLLELYAANKPKKNGISEKSSIDDSVQNGENLYVGDFTVIEERVQIGDNVSIYPQCYIGSKVRIGNNVTIYPGVKIYEDCVIGNNVVIQAGAVIGADGFGFAPQEDGTYGKIPQLGNVVLEDNVEIGANTCIDRATMGSTIISKGVKLDNLIQVGHNVQIGENTVAASQFGVAGSTKIGKNCMFGGQVGIAGHLVIADNVRAGSQAGIPNSIKKTGEAVMGTPALPVGSHHRSFILFKQLPDIKETINRLEKEIERLKELKN